MKRKVGELHNIPIVEGDSNLLTDKELLHKGGGVLSKRTSNGIEDLGGSSGSNGGGSDTEEDWEYYDVSSLNINGSSGTAEAQVVLLGCDILRCDDVVGTKRYFRGIGNFLSAFLITDTDTYTACGINLNRKHVDRYGTYLTTREFLKKYPDSHFSYVYTTLQSLPRITKEQFYSLN